MLQNAYLLANIGADTAENERNFAEKTHTPPSPSRVVNITHLLEGDALLASLHAKKIQAGIHYPIPIHLLGAGALAGKLAKYCKLLAGSFSAVSKWKFARKYAFDSIFQALQDVHIFAPLHTKLCS